MKVETILMHLENQNQLILHILEQLDQQAEPSAPGEQGANFPAGLFNHPC